MRETEKQRIRKEVLQARNSLTQDERDRMSACIYDRFCAIEQVKHCSSLMMFLSFGSEVNTDQIIRWAWQQGKRVLVPRCKPETREMVIYAIASFEEVQPGYFGIREPLQDVLEPVAKQEIDLVAVPAVAFDRKGYRVGYGGGYYDRFLASMNVPTIGLIFSCQLVLEVPTDKYDLPVQGIVTEKEFIAIGIP